MIAAIEAQLKYDALDWQSHHRHPLDPPPPRRSAMLNSPGLSIVRSVSQDAWPVSSRTSHYRLRASTSRSRPAPARIRDRQFTYIDSAAQVRRARRQSSASMPKSANWSGTSSDHRQRAGGKPQAVNDHDFRPRRSASPSPTASVTANRGFVASAPPTSGPGRRC